MDNPYDRRFVPIRFGVILALPINTEFSNA